ncbi:FG-GAP repeat domain-containing protein [Aquicoccus sp.]|uniref:FG-GAP repeat domain-containing protein n=1 Tax=Aquicoccus sp. TaxID=2055851 RepID=UPI00356897AD
MHLAICSLAVFLALAADVAMAGSGMIREARYTEPTTRYPHGALGDDVEWGALELMLAPCADCSQPGARTVTIRLPETRVFEDLAPRLVDLEGDGRPEVIVVESDMSQGARLAVYDETGMIANTPFIGRTNRWLAPVGSADFDGDGVREIAYIDRPHLAKTLRIWSFNRDGGMRHVADVPGLTNHRIGWDYIPGGIRDCGQGPEIITADAGWSRVMVTRFDGKGFASVALGPYRDQDDLGRAMACE